MRKLMLPALAACALLAVSAPMASAKNARAASLGGKLSQVSGALKGLQKAVDQMKDINDGQTGAINGVDTRVTTVVANLDALGKKVDAIVAVATDSLTKLQAGLLALKDGLTTAGAGLTSLSTAVQGPGIAGQLGAAGTAAPGSGNTATPSTLPTGTVYRQIVIASSGPLAGVGPIGARTWVKMPDAGAPLNYSNTYVCTSAGVTSAATGLGYSSASVACP